MIMDRERRRTGETLEGSVVLVTGAAGGIGLATCRAAREAGAVVVGTDLGPPPDPSFVDLWVPLDVTSISQWSELARTVDDQFGRLDCMVNNAGMALIETIESTNLELFRKVMAVNAEAPLIGLQTMLPLLRKAGAARPGGAAVVNVSSISGLHGSPLSGAYCASKGAVASLTKSAAVEFAQLGYPVRVNSVHPGIVDSPMAESLIERCIEMGLSTSRDEQRRIWAELSPMGRVGQAPEIADAILFLCSSRASFVTGTGLIVDGGTCA